MSIDAQTAGTESVVRKFLFDRTFDLPSQKETKEPPKPVFSEEQLNAAREEAFQQGYAAGTEASQKSDAAHQNILLSNIQQDIAKIAFSLSNRKDDQQADAVDVAFAIAQKLLPDLAAKNGLSEIEAMIRTIVHDLSKEPRLVIRLAESNFEAVEQKIKSITEANAFQGQVIVLADAHLGPADCRIEWADGGISRNEESFWNDMAKSVLKVQNAPLPTPHDQPVPPLATDTTA